MNSFSKVPNMCCSFSSVPSLTKYCLPEGFKDPAGSLIVLKDQSSGKLPD